MSSLAELERRNKAIVRELQQMDAVYAGVMLPQKAKDRWNLLTEELHRNRDHINKMRSST